MMPLRGAMQNPFTKPSYFSATTISTGNPHCLPNILFSFPNLHIIKQSSN
jgi:hypothetical protein